MNKIDESVGTFWKPRLLSSHVSLDTLAESISADVSMAKQLFKICSRFDVRHLHLAHVTSYSATLDGILNGTIVREVSIHRKSVINDSD